MNLAFREAATKRELKSLLDLRCGVYQRDRSLQTMASKTDISEFDLRSLHFGAFDEDRAVGYIRMVQEKESAFSPWVEKIGGNDIRVIPQQKQFPFELYNPYKHWSHAFLNDLRGKKIGEAGKLAIHEDYRKEGVLENFIHAFISYCNDTHHFDTGFGICTFALERFYKRLGFYRADGALPFIYKDLPEAVMLQFDSRSVQKRLRKPAQAESVSAHP